MKNTKELEKTSVLGRAPSSTGVVHLKHIWSSPILWKGWAFLSYPLNYQNPRLLQWAFDSYYHPDTKKQKEDYHNCSGTPLQISMDVTQKGCDLKLDGLLRTFIGLPCYRCGKPAVKRVFSNLCLLLREKPIEELFDMDMTIDFEKDKAETGYLDTDDGDEEELDLDLDDQMYFPFEEKEIDIAKYFRDIVHLEHSMDALGDLNCKGSCFNCGSNLNRSTCKCTNKNELVVDASIQKPNKQMQQQ